MTNIDTPSVVTKNRESIAFWWRVDTASPKELIEFFATPADSDAMADLSDDFIANIYDHKSSEFIEEFVRALVADIDGDAYLFAFTILANAKKVPPFTGDILEALLALPVDDGSKFMLVIDRELAFGPESANDDNIADLKERYRDFPVIDKVIARYYAEQAAAIEQFRERTTINT
jgi:hypothetical protein